MYHILLIEDNIEIRENTAEILQLAGYKVTDAENGKIGIEKALLHQPDLIICDIMMPVLDGYGVLHLLNKNEKLNGIPFVFLSAKSERGDLRKGMEMGADDYITKPFSDIELLNAIESRLSKAALLKKKYPLNADGVNEMLNELSKKNTLQNLTEKGNVQHYKKKQIIYSERNYPVQLFYIEKGKVKTYKSNEEGKDLTVGLYKEGEFFGYTALLEEAAYKESAEALEDTAVTIIAKEDFEKLLHANTEIQKKFIQLLAKNVSEKEEQMLAIAYNSLRKRVADALLTLEDKFKKDDDDIFSIHISRDDLANIAGTATESLIRTLSDFKNEKLIAINAGNISILNKEKLSSLLN